MIPTSFKNQIVVVLCHNFLGSSETFKITTECLAKASKIRGFCMAMMEIVDDVSFPVEVKQAALIQLKNTIKHRWVNQSQPLDKAQKQSIRGTLVLAIMRCHGNHKLIKLYKEILTIIVRYDYRIWPPVMQIVEMMQEARGTTTLLHILLGIAAGFEQCMRQEWRYYFFQFLKIVLPALQNPLQIRPQTELTYLSIKFLYKATHCQLSPELKQIICSWMGLLTAIVGATNPKYDQHPEDIQTRETEEFYYFHSKKWATRILLRFIEKHASSTVLNKQDNKPFSEQWYSTYGASLIDALVGQFSIPTIKKVRYFQLKCLHALILQKPETMKHYAAIFQYKVLLDYLRLQPKDYQLAMKEPLQFIFEEEQSSISNTNLKKVATDVWVAFASLGNKDMENTQPSQPGMFLFASMNYLLNKLEDRSNPQEKELAMYLLCKLSPELIKYKKVTNQLPDLLAKYILPELTSQVMFLRARALDIFRQLGSIKLKKYLVRQAVEGIFVCLTINPNPLVRIKAARAFNCILKHQIAKDLVKPILWYIYSFYFELLNSYDSQNIGKSLQSIVQNFATETIPFSVVLVKYLTILFFNFFNKDRQSEQQEYKNYVKMAAASYLSTIKTIISSSIPSECATTIEADVFSIIQYTMQKQDPKFMQLALDVLNAFLLKVPQVSSQIQFLYKVVVFNIVGITKTMWLNIQTIEMPLSYQNIMKTIRNVQNIRMMERSIPILRNYIKKSSENTESNHLSIKANIVQILFYLISQIYKRPLSDFDGQYQIECCTNLLTCLLQNYRQTLPQLVYIYVYEYIKTNITKFKGKKLKFYTSQLIGMLLWVAPSLALKLANTDGLLSIFLKQLISYHSKYNDKLQRARVILGINSLLLLDQKPPTIAQHISQLFKTAVILVQKSAQQRIGDGQNQVQGEKSEQFGKDQDEDEEVFRQIENQDKYESPLCSIDQILQFKTTKERLSCEQTQMYSELLETVGAKDWAIFKDKIRKALEKAGHKFD